MNPNKLEFNPQANLLMKTSQGIKHNHEQKKLAVDEVDSIQIN